MFKFRFVNKDLLVDIPSRFVFDFDFHISIARLCWYLDTARKINPGGNIVISCEAADVSDKMCAACLYNVLDYFSKRMHMTIYVTQPFMNSLKRRVKRQTGENYRTEINFLDLVFDDTPQYYIFYGDKNTDKPIKHIVDIISSLSVSLNPDEFSDFLVTTIGEIFSNSTNHSEQDEVYFMFDVELEKDNSYYLSVNIIDYGTTIVHNVRRFKKDDELSGTDCMNWAIQKGNTTREGSGGYGLSTLIEYIKAVKGSLYIFSGDSHFILNPNNKSFTGSIEKELFCGTSVTFKVKLFDFDNVLTYKSGSIGSINLASLSSDYFK